MKQRILNRTTLIKSATSLLLLLLGSWGLAPAARAEEITVSCAAGVAGLKEAIHRANDETTNPGPDTISLEGSCTYSLTTVDNNSLLFGANGLPIITGDLVIKGNGATIERSPQTAEQFRILQATGNLTLQDLTVQNGQLGFPNEGSGAGVAAANLVLVRVNIKDNNARFDGGGVRVTGSAVISGSRFEDNHADNGGAVYAGIVTLSDTVFVDNGAGVDGGGLWANRAVVTGARFDRNYARHGGAIFVKGSLVLNRSKFAGNQANEGMGLYLIQQDAASRLVNNLWLDHTRSSSDPGLAVITAGPNEDGAAPLTIAYNTIAGSALAKDNRVAGVFLRNVPAVLHNNIISKHDVGVNATVEVTTDHNLYFDNNTNEQGTTSRNNLTADPLFVDPANGDYHLQAGSPAIDQGLDVCVPVDLDAGPRPVDGNGDGVSKSDIGALEFVDAAGPNPGGRLACLTPPSGPDRISFEAAISADGRTIVFESDSDFNGEGIPDNQIEIWRYDADSGQLSRVTTASGPDRDSLTPALSADGRTIVFHSDSDFKGEGIPDNQNEIWRYDVTSGQLSRVTTASGPDRSSFDAAISADGRTIVFVSDSDFNGEGIPNNQAEIWRYDVASGQLSRVTTASGPDRDSRAPALSADGRTIVFHSDSDFKGEGIPDNQNEIWRYDVTSGQLNRVTTASEPDRDSFEPALSPDGRTIVFHSDSDFKGEGIPDNQNEIWRYDVAGGQLSRVTTASGPDRDSLGPALSADGRTIVFESDSDFNGENISDDQVEIWWYDAAGGQLSRVTTASGPDRGSFDPALSADGRTLVFESDADFGGLGTPEGQHKIWLYDGPPPGSADPDPGGEFTLYLPLVVR